MGLVSTGRGEEVRNPPWPTAARALAVLSAQAAWFRFLSALSLAGISSILSLAAKGKVTGGEGSPFLSK